MGNESEDTKEILADFISIANDVIIWKDFIALYAK